MRRQRKMDDVTMAVRRLLVSSGIALALGGCSNLVNADRSKIPDTLYQPSPTADAGGRDGAATDTGEAADGGADDDAVSGDGGSPSDSSAGDGSPSDSSANDSGVDAGSGGDSATGQ